MKNIPTLESHRLILRAPTQADFAPFAEFYASERSRFVGGPLNSELSWRMLAMEIGHWSLLGYGRWIAEEKTTGKAAGLIGLFNPHGWPEAEIGWDLFTGFEGKGYATEAALAARQYAYDVLGWQTAISLVKPGNDGSAAVATRMGAVQDGTFTHERHGSMAIYRHPAPDTLTDGNIEAYA
jgi:RimJ/RimL family protein N-acetyltransferase